MFTKLKHMVSKNVRGDTVDLPLTPPPDGTVLETPYPAVAGR